MPPGLTSPFHLLVIMFVALVVLGPDKLPVAVRQVGKTIGELRRWSDTISNEVRGALSLDADDGPGAPGAPGVAPVVPPPVAGSVPSPPAVSSTHGSAAIPATSTPVPLDVPAASADGPATARADGPTSSAEEWGIAPAPPPLGTEEAPAPGTPETNGHAQPAREPGGEWS